MKFVKMSLAAAMLMGASAYAIENVKVSGTASLYYHTQDTSVVAGTDVPDLFDKGASNADIGFSLGATADLTPGVSAGVTAYGITTLGLEGTLVDGVWSNAHTAAANDASGFLVHSLGGTEVNDAYWVGEAWLAGTLGKTTAKIGRMALDTPLAFTETWGIAPNTFEAAVLLNQDIPGTTLVAAYVGKYNGGGAGDSATSAGLNGLNGVLYPSSIVALTGIMAPEGEFHSFYDSGAYVVGAINNSFEPLTVQGWYYDIQSVAEAYWLQADLNIAGFMAGAQYTNIEVNLAAGLPDDEAYALMLGYALKDVATFKVAYSEVDDRGVLGVGNVATTRGQSKLYTELWWNFGAAQTGAKTFALTADANLGGVDLFAGYWDVDVEPAGIGNDSEINEYVITAGKSFGPLDATLALIYDEYDAEGGLGAGEIEDVTALQVYLTYNF